MYHGWEEPGKSFFYKNRYPREMAALYRPPPPLPLVLIDAQDVGESILAVALSQYKRVHKISRRGHSKKHGVKNVEMMERNTRFLRAQR